MAGLRGFPLAGGIVDFVARERDISPTGFSDKLKSAHVQDAGLDGLLVVSHCRLMLGALTTAAISPCWLRLLY